MSETHEVRYITKSGRHIWTNNSAAPFFSKEDGSYQGTLSMVTDITARKLAEADRDKLINDLIIKNKDLEQFSYIISHNLRGPVASIIGASNALNNFDLTAAEKETLNNGISESVKRLDEVIIDLNDILQVKIGFKENKEKVIFSHVVDNVKASIKGLLNDVEILCDFSEIDEYTSLKAYFYSIFYNLISNSIKYRRHDIHTVIQIKSHLYKNKLELIFSDNGMGIDLAKKGSQVFGLYNRFHTNIEGKGVGLFMVKTQVETLGGKISIQSKVNEGTEFKIQLEL